MRFLSRRGISFDVPCGVHILSVVEQSSLESRSRGYAKRIPILTVVVVVDADDGLYIIDALLKGSDWCVGKSIHGFYVTEGNGWWLGKRNY